MRQRRALVVARRLIEIEAKALACRQHRFAVLQLADAQLGPLHVGEDADRPLQLVLDRADGILALSMVVVRAEIGRTTGRERGCPYGKIEVVAGMLKKKK